MGVGVAFGTGVGAGVGIGVGTEIGAGVGVAVGTGAGVGVCTAGVFIGCVIPTMVGCGGRVMAAGSIVTSGTMTVAGGGSGTTTKGVGVLGMNSTDALGGGWVGVPTGAGAGVLRNLSTISSTGDRASSL